eukprot:GCRY01004918.1.p1 GENE.GCRY01004918.1~~GCRY01004918.1.p1  ORF type:complete len:874 (-),score=140.93 GCRY01004918.1:483-3104(-)
MGCGASKKKKEQIEPVVVGQESVTNLQSQEEMSAGSGNSFSEAHQHLQKENEDLKKENTALKSEIETLEQHNATLRANLEEMLLSDKFAEHSSSVKSTRNLALKEELMHSESQRNHLEEEMKELQKELAVMKQEPQTDSMSSLVEDVREKNHKLNSRVEELERELSILRKEKAQLQGEMVTLLAGGQDFDEVEDFEVGFEEKDAKHEELEEMHLQIQHLQREKESLQDIVAQREIMDIKVQAKMDHLLKRNEELDSLSEKLKSTISLQKEQLEEQEKEVLQLNRQLEERTRNKPLSGSVSDQFPPERLHRENTTAGMRQNLLTFSQGESMVMMPVYARSNSNEEAFAHRTFSQPSTLPQLDEISEIDTAEKKLSSQNSSQILESQNHLEAERLALQSQLLSLQKESGEFIPPPSEMDLKPKAISQGIVQLYVPNDQQMKLLEDWLTGDSTLNTTDLYPYFTEVEHNLLFEWLLWMMMQVKRLTKLINLTKMATTSLTTTDDMMTRIVKETAKALNCERAAVFVVKSGLEAFRCIYCTSTSKESGKKLVKSGSSGGMKVTTPRAPFTGFGKPPAHPAKSKGDFDINIHVPKKEFDSDRGLVGYVFHHRETVNVPSLAQDDRYDPECDSLFASNPKMLAAAPIIVHGGKVIGVLMVVNSHTKRSFSSKETVILESMAVKAGVHLTRSQTLDQIDRITHDNPFLLSVMKIHEREISLKRTIAQTVAKVCDILECERASVFLADVETQELFTETNDGEIRFPWDKGIAGECFQTGKVIFVNNPYSDHRFNPEFDRRSGFKTRSLMCIPLYDEDAKIIGVIQAINKGEDEDDEFNDDDTIYFKQMGTQEGASLRYALIYQRASAWENSQMHAAKSSDL